MVRSLPIPFSFALIAFLVLLVQGLFEAETHYRLPPGPKLMGTKGVSAGFQPIQEKEAVHFILQTFDDPDSIMANLKT